MSQTSANMGSSIRAISLIASIAAHAMVLAGIPALIGETGTGLAENSSTLRLSVHRLEPADTMPRDNPGLNPLEQSSAQPQLRTTLPQKIVQQPEPLPVDLKVKTISAKTSAKHDLKIAPIASMTASIQPASSKRGADVNERQPMQVAASGRYARLTRDYRSTLLRLIERHKYYPIHARRNGLEGTSTVAFTVNRNGAIGDISLARSSGTTLLDQAAVQTIIRINNAPPFPADIKRSQWSFAIPIAYNLK